MLSPSLKFYSVDIEQRVLGLLALFSTLQNLNFMLEPPNLFVFSSFIFFESIYLEIDSSSPFFQKTKNHFS